MSKKIYIVIILLVLVFIVINVIFNSSSENNKLEVNINEKILLDTSIIKGGIINNETETKYIYSFVDNSITVNSGTIDFVAYDYKKSELNIEIENGILYISGKKRFSCNISSCKSYFDINGRYIIFVDRYLHREFIFKKLLAFNSIRVFDLKTLEYKNFPILDYNGNELNIQGISGYIN